MKAIELCKRVALKDLAFRYCEATWRAWYGVKTKAVKDPRDPMLGGPQQAIAKGITAVTKPDGGTIVLNKLTRIRLRELSDASLSVLGVAFGKDLLAIKAELGDKGLGKDVFHQEYVDTFKENIENDNKHLLNNLVSVSAVLDGVMSFIATPEMEMEEFANVLEDFAGNEARSRLISIATRSSWLGRAAQDGSWASSADFSWYRELKANVAEIDPYVAAPVLKMLAVDIREGRV
jgi:hypothetical protein